MQLNFVTVDVFTDRRFGGNPLAVVPDARGLTSAQMQAIAAEFNLSETTFVLPPQLTHGAYSLRKHVPLISVTAMLPSHGKRLAWGAAGDDHHITSAQRAVIE